MEAQAKRLLIYLILPLVLLTAATYIAVYQSRLDFKLHAYFFDSGKGPAILIKTYQGNKIVIDGGPDDKILSELGTVLPFYDHNIDLLILTNLDNAHATGLVDILKRYSVKQVILPDGELTSSAAREFLALIDNKHVIKNYLHLGQRIWLDASTVLDISSVPPKFAGQIIFGKTKISIPDDNNYGELISDGTTFIKK